LLLHALTDALLGALALGDIGHYFPDTDPAFRNADSAELLGQVWQEVNQRGFVLGNVDITLIGEHPRLALYVPAIRERIAGLLAVDRQAVSVKATTTEKLGFAGRGEGLIAMAVVLLESAST
jgi:2-C-methyl-D-erythritol 2,4-cyclodiphosphate synthase